VSGGGDKICKLWDYDEGLCKFIGIGHSSGITKAAISPDQQTIVTTGEEGAIFLWHLPALQLGAHQAQNQQQLVEAMKSLSVSQEAKGELKLPVMNGSPTNSSSQNQGRPAGMATSGTPQLPLISATGSAQVQTRNGGKKS